MNLCIPKPRPAPLGRFSKCGSTRLALISVAVGLLVSASPVVLEGQGSGPLSESWTVGLSGGVFSYEPSGDEGFPIIALRMDQPVSRWVRFEVGTTYTRPEIQTNAAMMFDPTLPAEHTNLFTVTLGGQAKWTLGPLEPYGGFSAGFFGRYDGGPTDRRFGRSTLQFPFGIRLWVTDHIGVRAEYRFDEDNHEVVTHSDSEWTTGVFWTL